MNSPEKTYEKLKNVVNSQNFQDKINAQILGKLYEEIEKGNSNISQILNQEQDENLVNRLTEIMAYDFEIADMDKAAEDLVVIYEKEKLVQRRNEILKSLENATNEDARELENELNEVILKLAKIK